MNTSCDLHSDYAHKKQFRKPCHAFMNTKNDSLSAAVQKLYKRMRQSSSTLAVKHNSSPLTGYIVHLHIHNSYITVTAETAHLSWRESQCNWIQICRVVNERWGYLFMEKVLNKIKAHYIGSSSLWISYSFICLQMQKYSLFQLVVSVNTWL